MRVDLTGTRELHRLALYALAAFCVGVGVILYTTWRVS